MEQAVTQGAAQLVGQRIPSGVAKEFMPRKDSLSIIYRHLFSLPESLFGAASIAVAFSPETFSHNVAFDVMTGL